VIFASDKDKFGDLGSLQGKRVEIRGDVVTYQGRAEIIIRDSQQVRSAP
jgi:DNA/RNA endonuclease YhcR with UshA esterase domain